MSEYPEAPRSQSPLTDSPWFWVMLFSAMGLALLVAMSPKYAKRQGRLEMQYQARQETLRRQFEGTPTAREPGEEGEATPPTELIIPLWPLAGPLAMMWIVSAIFLWRGRRSRADRAGHKDHVG